MKIKFLVLIILLWASTASALDVTFQWTANVEPDIVGYNIYKATNNEGPWNKLNSETIIGTEYTYSFTEPEETTWYFYCTALDQNLESAPSNIVSTRIDTIPPSAPNELKFSINITVNLGGN